MTFNLSDNGQTMNVGILGQLRKCRFTELLDFVDDAVFCVLFFRRSPSVPVFYPV